MPTKPFRKRRFLLVRIRFENRLARRLRRLSERLSRDTNRLTSESVVAYHKAQGTWPQPDHIYPEMRG
jgi:predicted transcriptional regulator